jgi:hypothetical protein
MDLTSAEKVLVKPPRKRPLADEIAALRKQQDETISLIVGLCSQVGKLQQDKPRRGIRQWFQEWCG